MSCLASSEANSVRTKIFESSKTLWPGLSENFLFALYISPMMIQISGKSTNLTKKCHFYQKTTNKQSWKLLKVKFLI